MDLAILGRSLSPRVKRDFVIILVGRLIEWGFLINISPKSFISCPSSFTRFINKQRYVLSKEVQSVSWNFRQRYPLLYTAWLDQFCHDCHGLDQIAQLFTC